MIDLSIILVNYNTTSLLADAIESVVQHTKQLDYEIIVVDNASTDDVLSLQTKFPAIKLKILSQNVGFGRANNAGVEEANGRNILFLNPDTLLEDNSLKLLSDYLDAHEKVGICGANLYDANRLPAHSFKRLFPGILVELDAACKGCLLPIRYGKNKEFNYGSKPLEVAYICGADLMIKRNVWDEVGGFDPAIFMYYEDALLCYQVKKKGYQVVSVPAAKVVHLEGKSFTLNEKRESIIFAGRNVFFTTVYSSFYHKCANFMGRMLLRVGIFVAKRKHNPSEAQKFAYRYGLYKNKKV